MKQLDSHKATLGQVDMELINLKCRLSEFVAVNGNVSTLPFADDYTRDNLGTCGSANVNVNDNNNDSIGGYNDVRDGTVNSNNVTCLTYQSNAHCVSRNCGNTSFMATSDLTLPYFNDSTKINA
jgi:hypothetical protein